MILSVFSLRKLISVLRTSLPRNPEQLHPGRLMLLTVTIVTIVTPLPPLPPPRDLNRGIPPTLVIMTGRAGTLTTHGPSRTVTPTETGIPIAGLVIGTETIAVTTLPTPQPPLV